MTVPHPVDAIQSAMQSTGLGMLVPIWVVMAGFFPISQLHIPLPTKLIPTLHQQQLISVSNTTYYHNINLTTRYLTYRKQQLQQCRKPKRQKRRQTAKLTVAWWALCIVPWVANSNCRYPTCPIWVAWHWHISFNHRLEVRPKYWSTWSIHKGHSLRYNSRLKRERKSSRRRRKGMWSTPNLVPPRSRG